jgi:hypothetical protein
MLVLAQNAFGGELAEGARFALPHVFKGPGAPVVNLVPVERLGTPSARAFSPFLRP